MATSKKVKKVTAKKKTPAKKSVKKTIANKKVAEPIKQAIEETKTLNPCVGTGEMPDIAEPMHYGSRWLLAAILIVALFVGAYIINKDKIKSFALNNTNPVIKPIIPVASGVTASTEVNDRLEALSKVVGTLNRELEFLHNHLTETATNDINHNIIDPQQVFLGQMIVFLDSNYKRGGNIHSAIKNIRDFSAAITKNDVIVNALNTLISVTDKNGPVTLHRLGLEAAHLAQLPAPNYTDLAPDPELVEATEILELAENEESFKERFSKWISLKRLELEQKVTDYNDPWKKDMNQLEILIASGNVEKAQDLINSSSILSRDARLDELKAMVTIYLQQQQALNNVLDVYAESYVIHTNASPTEPKVPTLIQE